MTTLRRWFDRFTEVTGETPESVVFDWGDWAYKSEGWPTVPTGIVAWGDVPADVLDKEFDDGFGCTESPNLCAWSPTCVIFSDNYDGAEGLTWVPRNPTEHNPTRPGGG